MKIKGAKRSKNGSWQTSVDVLQSISDNGYEIADLILEWRHFSKLKSTYTDALQEHIHPETGRVHTSYSIAGTSTGRLASTDPNLQNIPIRSEDDISDSAFESKEGVITDSEFLNDLSCEDAINLSIKHIVETFDRGVDIHADTASKVFNIPLQQMTSDIRRKAKAINFGIIYGISQYGLSKQLKCSPNEAKEFINSYFIRFPRIRDYMEDIKNQLQEKGYVETLLKRRLYISGGDAKNQNLRAFAERPAINAPIQGTAADIIKNAMILIHRELSDYKKDVSMLMQVHDELVFEINKNKLQEVQNIILPIMEKCKFTNGAFECKIKVDTGYGDNWAEAH